MVVTLLISTLLGALSGLGVGGGSLLMLWLTLGLGMEQAAAGTINLLYFLPSAAIACCFRWKQGVLPLKKIVPAIVAGTISTALFTLWSADWDTHYLRKGFGILLLFTGVRELLFREKK